MPAPLFSGLYKLFCDLLIIGYGSEQGQRSTTAPGTKGHPAALRSMIESET